MQKLFDACFAAFFAKARNADTAKWRVRIDLHSAIHIYATCMQTFCHAVKDANGRSYNRTQYLKQRFDQIQQWADYLDKLRVGGEVIQFQAVAK